MRNLFFFICLPHGAGNSSYGVFLFTGVLISGRLAPAWAGGPADLRSQMQPEAGIGAVVIVVNETCEVKEDHIFLKDIARIESDPFFEKQA